MTDGIPGAISNGRGKRATESYDEYYKRKLDDGIEFQDVVTKALYKKGIVIVGYSSKRFQLEEGENILGAEIKKDEQFRETGNLWIEVAEKSNPDKQADYRPSGIRRDDNSWLYVIGDERTLWIFSCKHLRGLQARYTVIPNKTKSSLGYLITTDEADRQCLTKFNL